MKKINEFFFDDGVALSETIFYYGIIILMSTIGIFSLIGIVTL